MVTLPPKILNRFSKIITQDPTLGAAQAMLMATVKSPSYIHKPMIGICSMWYQGNPCNMHLNILADRCGKSVLNHGMIERKFNTIGISDGITMGTSGMQYSLPSRELICDSIECMMKGMHYDALVCIPGCDKNIPASLMAMLRVNRPALLVYGGSIMPGVYKNKEIDILDAFQAYGQVKAGKITETERSEIISCACNRGPGSCGGMYTANTMAIISEIMGLSLPNSSSNPAISDDKRYECDETGSIIKMLMQKDLKPQDIITRKSIENAVTMAMAMGGSTNMILHVLAICAEIPQIKFTLEDFQKISDKTPVIGNFKPYGEYRMHDLYKMGGTSVIAKYLLSNGYLHGDCMTVTGQTLSDNLFGIPSESFTTKQIIFPLETTQYKTSHIKVLYGNLCPGGAIAKISDPTIKIFKGSAQVFDTEIDAINALLQDKIQKGDIIIIRYQGPKAGGMAEMLRLTSMLVGLDLADSIALLTDGRFSGGSKGIIVGHIVPEACIPGSPLSSIQNGDMITIDIINRLITVEQNHPILPLQSVKKSPRDTTYLQRYTTLVNDASQGCTLRSQLEIISD